MTQDEFLKLLQQNTTKTTNIGVFTGEWCSGVEKISHEVIIQIGKVINVLQKTLHKCPLFDLNHDFLLVYNCQLVNADSTFFSLDTMIKPLSEKDRTDDISTGTPYQIYVDGKSGKVMNEEQALIELPSSLPTTPMNEESGKEKIIFSENFYKEQSVCAFIAPLPSNDLETFTKEIDNYLKSKDFGGFIHFFKIEDAKKFYKSSNQTRFFLEVNNCKSGAEIRGKLEAIHVISEFSNEGQGSPVFRSCGLMNSISLKRKLSD